MKCHDIFADAAFQPEYNLSDSTFYCDIESFSDAIFRHVTANASQFSHNCHIYDMAEKFIEKYRLKVNDDYRRILSLIDQPDSYVILYPYQPNIFPSVSVVAPFVYMNLVASMIKCKYGVTLIPVYLIVDYDCKTDRRFSS